MEIENPLRILLFWSKVIVGNKDECWNWIGAKDKKGYGLFTVGKRRCGKAHRFSFLLHWGWITSAGHIHHKCNNTSCVNPYHLKLISNKENNELSTSPSAINKKKTHCIRGHPFDEYNTKRENGHRRCKICERERSKSFIRGCQGST